MYLSRYIVRYTHRHAQHTPLEQYRKDSAVEPNKVNKYPPTHSLCEKAKSCGFHEILIIYTGNTAVTDVHKLNSYGSIKS